MNTATATAPEPRCPSCLMPTEVTDGVAAVHDFPYTVSNYGQCKGSGKQALPGPATPPPVWGVDFTTYVDLGVLPSPLPQVQRDGWTVTITGLRFVHFVACAHCRRVVFTTTEGGTIKIGFDHKGRSFQTEHPGGRAAYCGPCPNDSSHQAVIGGPWGDKPRSRPADDGYTVQSREWERLRRDLDVQTVDMTPAHLKRLRAA